MNQANYSQEEIIDILSSLLERATNRTKLARLNERKKDLQQTNKSNETEKKLEKETEEQVNSIPLEPGRDELGLENISTAVELHTKEVKELINEGPLSGSDENTAICKEDMEKMLNEHFEKVEKLIERYTLNPNHLSLSERFKEFQEKLKRLVSEFKQSLKEKIAEAKNQVTSSLTEKVEHIKQYANEKIEASAFHLNNKLKELSREIDHKLDKTPTVETERSLDNKKLNEMTVIDAKIDEITKKQVQLNQILETDLSKKIVSQIQKNELFLSSLDNYITSAATSQIQNLQKDLSSFKNTISPQEMQKHQTRIESIEEKIHHTTEKMANLKDKSEKMKEEEMVNGIEEKDISKDHVVKKSKSRLDEMSLER